VRGAVNVSIDAHPYNHFLFSNFPVHRRRKNTARDYTHNIRSYGSRLDGETLRVISIYLPACSLTNRNLVTLGTISGKLPLILSEMSLKLR
jgi:hypothetical protein